MGWTQRLVNSQIIGLSRVMKFPFLSPKPSRYPLPNFFVISALLISSNSANHLPNLYRCETLLPLKFSFYNISFFLHKPQSEAKTTFHINIPFIILILREPQ
eukprot:TRINITY_DN18038_c1_g1_i1.p1 TRINITY_DN18038_c1_g1~~TRINITY_DN18038_c1_g1_i1.p1  ORF type:complete len:102 (-),score=5.57 TRINITY_DN18038_c1_g1_i1:226-531(-)